MKNKVINFRFSEPFIPAFSKWLSEYMKQLNPKEVLLLTPTHRSVLKLRQSVIGHFRTANYNCDVQALSVFDLWHEGEHEGPDPQNALLAKMIFDYFEHQKSISQCLAIAQNVSDLATLLELEEIDLQNYGEYTLPETSTHSQENIAFLKRVIEPRKELADKANKMKNSLNQLSQKLKSDPPQYPVFAIGINGAFPSVNRLIKTVFELPFGHVILNGADHDILKHPLKPQSPQHSFQRLFRFLGIGLDEASTVASSCSPQTEKHINAALSTCSLNILNDIPSITIIECKNPQEEAAVNAHIIKETFPIPGIMSADSSSAMRIKEILRLFDFGFDDSQPVSVSKSSEFTLLQQIAEVISGNFSAHQVIETLKKICTLDEKIFKELAAFELMLRNQSQTPKHFLEAVSKNNQFIKEKMLNSAQMIEDLASFISHAAPSTNRISPLGDWIKAFKDFIIFLDKKAFEHTGKNILTPGSDTAGIWDRIEDLLRPLNNEVSSTDEYIGVLSAVFRGIKSTNENINNQKNVSALGVLESRLLDANTVIIPDCNDGTWPPVRGLAGVLFGQNIIGVSAFDRKIELFGLEFIKALCCKNVILTRSKMKDGSPTQPSKWLVRLMASLKNNGESARKRGNEWLNFVRDSRPLPSPASPPKPTLPVGKKISELSLSDFNVLFQNPYEIYAKHILKLSPCPDFWVKASKIQSLRKKISDQEVVCFESGINLQQLRERRILSELNKFHENSLTQYLKDIDESITFTLTDGNTFKVKTKFDLVKSSSDWSDIEIASYKGSAISNITDIRAGLDLKINLQIIIAKNNIFSGYNLREANARFLHLDGGINPIGEKVISGEKIIANQEGIIKKIQSELNKFFNDGIFLARPHCTGLYSHLMRVKEWLQLS
ncbi:MAG: hypothetical protein LBI30_02905 [Holosporales bacterium]|jgi:inactivated superfamily I helicase|nr:hypothetical protein [Holosporales bacterium]